MSKNAVTLQAFYVHCLAAGVDKWLCLKAKDAKAAANKAAKTLSLGGAVGNYRFWVHSSPEETPMHCLQATLA